MDCFSGQCFKALALILLVVFCPSVGSAQELLMAGFGGGKIDSASFVVGDGRHAVTVGVAGKSLGAAQLVGAPVAPVKKVSDPISRLVVFEMPSPLKGAFKLANRAPTGGLLRTPGGDLGGRILARVDRVSGKFLPFTLLQLGYDGNPPTPGTPLLDAKGSVAGIAYEAVGAKGGYALPVEVLQRVLAEVGQGKGVQRAWLGLKLNPASGQPRVTRTVNGSPANRAGLLAGDLLVEVGGVRVLDYGDAVNEFFLLRSGQPTQVRVKRGGAEKVLEMVPVMAKR
ncbi:PDZ domain-containing protein [Haloferula sp.]|uniref:PDZ domain-containing protein n=1 Tax=Haloferula sp. TaxID=2497595 RepID=UPI00329C14D3